VEIGECYTKYAGFAVVHHKPLGYLIEPQNRGRRLDEGVQPPRPVQPPRRGDQTVWAGLTAQGGQSDRPGHNLREASKRRTRDMITRVVLVLRRLAVDAHPSDGAELKTSEIALEWLVSLVASNGSLVFWLPPYKHFSCGMATNSWNPSSFPFLFSVGISRTSFRASW
jgi:hypothetical protein